MQYAVRGALVARAAKYEAVLAAGAEEAEALPFDSVTWCNIGNPHERCWGSGLHSSKSASNNRADRNAPWGCEGEGESPANLLLNNAKFAAG